MRACFAHYMLFSMFALVFEQNSFGESAIQVSGTYQGQIYIRKTGSYTNSDLRVGFVAFISKDARRICATNLDDPASWGEVACDGTNTYTRVPYGNHFATSSPQSNAIFSTISPSPLYSPCFSDLVRIYIPWLTFGFNPSKMVSNSEGVFDIPLPWYIPRVSLAAYGYKWMIRPSDDQSFLASCEVVRDPSLDLDYESELHRFEFDNPLSLEDLARCRDMIGVRKFVPKNFVDTRYSCTKWFSTNGVSVPSASKTELFRAGQKTSDPMFVVNLTVSSVVLIDDPADGLVPKSDVANYVWDYRYRKTNTTHKFQFAKYTLGPGESWKPADDPAILAEANNFLESGRKFGYFSVRDYLFGTQRRTKITLAWLLLIVIQIIWAAMLWKKRLKTKKQQENI